MVRSTKDRREKRQVSAVASPIKYSCGCYHCLCLGSPQLLKMSIKLSGIDGSCEHTRTHSVSLVYFYLFIYLLFCSIPFIYSTSPSLWIFFVVLRSKTKKKKMMDQEISFKNRSQVERQMNFTSYRYFFLR